MRHRASAKLGSFEQPDLTIRVKELELLDPKLLREDQMRILAMPGADLIPTIVREKLCVARLQREVAQSKSEGAMVKLCNPELLQAMAGVHSSKPHSRWINIFARVTWIGPPICTLERQNISGLVLAHVKKGSQREKLIHELEEERHLRLESEKRLREVTLESERSRAQMRGLQEQFSRLDFIPSFLTLPPPPLSSRVGVRVVEEAAGLYKPQDMV
ncbi:hypothetical protein DUI87_04684 [Hirundo rustica rustica]|uniref:Uncharacterized protein n=1 Tax=Hirundo rustica rustica TaxID=333673 RepID=A0A3M0KZU4_HIRRU|nr:hypothetical protein DUI87_04684 [Hirundo rustica rustica]